MGLINNYTNNGTFLKTTTPAQSRNRTHNNLLLQSPFSFCCLVKKTLFLTLTNAQIPPPYYSTETLDTEVLDPSALNYVGILKIW
jgi:hypothetical protein